MKTILVVDDEHTIRLSLKAVFEPTHRVILAADGDEAVQAVRRRGPDLAIVDLMMPGMSGLELIPLLKREDPTLTVIVLSAMNDIPNVVEAMKVGASQYLTKPFDVAEIRLKIDMLLRDAGRQAELAALETEISRWYDVDHIIGESPVWRETLSTLQRAAASREATIMLYGESGTGKELLARRIHRLSPRSDAAMVPIHCAAIPEALLESEFFGHEKGSFTGATERRRGNVELADGGTLFLDEIGEMPTAMQSKLLRFLQDHEFTRVGGNSALRVDVRVIAATNRDLRAGIEAGWFREDLYYRLNVVPVTLPPLRDRQGDIPLLVRHHVGRFAQESRAHMSDVAPQAMAWLGGYTWPGNVRELRNVIERAVVLHGDAPALLPEHLPMEITGVPAASPAPAATQTALPISLQDEVRMLEERWIRIACEESGGNLSKAAVLLGTTRRILKYKIDQHNL